MGQPLCRPCRFLTVPCRWRTRCRRCVREESMVSRSLRPPPSQLAATLRLRRKTIQPPMPDRRPHALLLVMWEAKHDLRVVNLVVGKSISRPYRLMIFVHGLFQSTSTYLQCVFIPSSSAASDMGCHMIIHLKPIQNGVLSRPSL